ncbi:PP2C domain-containing protein [Cephalotus follicularis]|uniref:protein-serine/threonine phosphatase n=1 Tax=Cephalotus follicularis TaxID=3775 RepID=A0A1Q3BAI6_CEPFO|nr:PP2C domain-containing protein [Cephalotus follicularis]
MPHSVAVASPTIFSPGRLALSFRKSPRIHGTTPPPPASPSTPTLTSTTSSPGSPFSLRIHKQIAELRSPPPLPSSPSTTEGFHESLLFVLMQKQIDEFSAVGCKNVEEVKKGSVLKRKRPTRINIPVVMPVNFGFATPRVEEEEERVDELEMEGDGYSVYCKRGRRGLMEDRYSAIVGLQGDDRQALFGVFDGHGGTKAAAFAAKNLANNIMAEVSSRCEGEIESAIKNGYLTTDAEFLKEGFGGGTCCLTALIRKGNLVVSNAGDCRAVMSQGGVAVALTSDHQPWREGERERIQALGGYVDCCNGVWRIQGSLAVTRGIGDMHLKQWVIAEPETKVLRIQPECEFLILASDGLWDKVTNQEAVDSVRPLSIGVEKPELFCACKKLVNLSLSRGSMDDITVVVIQLGCFAS